MKENSKRENIRAIVASKKKRMKNSTVQQLTAEILSGDTKSLSRAITLIESKKKSDAEIAQAILQQALPSTGNSIRIGITGVPGVGKSTFIEAFGNHLTRIGKKIAVLAIDPSSERSKGSILGDKTRMESLSTNKNAFIRPSASSGSLGGVARKTNETILLCEACGFDVILIETVGVGQSETAVRKMCDFFLLLMLAGAGDELQGIKRGIMEMADALLITKADGDNKVNAKKAASAYKMAMHLFPPNSSGWTPETGICSAVEDEGIEEIWRIIEAYFTQTTENNFFTKNRLDQREFWLRKSFEDKLIAQFEEDESWQKKFATMLREVKKGKLTPYAAADELL